MTVARTLALAIVAVTVLSGPGAAEPVFQPLAGEYAIASKTLIDPPPEEKKDRALFFIEGDAAREMFAAMPAPPRRDRCEPDSVTKIAGGLLCSMTSAGDYLCSFGLLLASGAVTRGSVC